MVFKAVKCYHCKKAGMYDIDIIEEDVINEMKDEILQGIVNQIDMGLSKHLIKENCLKELKELRKP